MLPQRTRDSIAANQAYPVLLECQRKGEVISYADLARSIRYDTRGMGWILWGINAYCAIEGQEETLGLLVVDRNGNPTAPFVNHAQRLHRLFEQDWSNVKAPTPGEIHGARDVYPKHVPLYISGPNGRT